MKTKKKPARKLKTKTVIIEVETSASNEKLQDHRMWLAALQLLDAKGAVRQVTVQVADRTK
jgi:uncharacterized membrane-anchored protein